MLPFAPGIYNSPVGSNRLDIQPQIGYVKQQEASSASFAGISTGTFQRYWWLIAIAAGVIGFFVGRGRFKL